MPLYEHHCNQCSTALEIEYPLYDFDKNRNHPCPVCGDETSRLVGGSTFILTGGGWARDNYSKLGAYEEYKKTGNNVTLFDSKEDHDRVARGEAEEAEKRKLKRLDAISKKAFGPDAGVSEKKAAERIKQAGTKRVDGL